MKCHILRWNPNISSYTKERHSFFINATLKNEFYQFDWSIYDWKEAESGDFFILQQVGTEEDGIAAFGLLSGPVFERKSWRKDGTKSHYCDLNIWAIINRDICKKFSAVEMEKICPEVDWHGGHSGVLVSEETGEKIFLHLFMNLMGTLGPNPAIAFKDIGEEDLQDNFVDYLDVMAPNFFKHFYETNDCECINCGKILDTKPPVEDVEIFWKTGQAYYRHYPENPTIKDLENYLVLNGGYCPDCDAEHDDDFYEKCAYPHIENHSAIARQFNNFYTWFHDDYITDVIEKDDYIEIRIKTSGNDVKQFDKEKKDWIIPIPCLVCIECHGVVNTSSLNKKEYEIQPLYGIKTKKTGDGYKLILNGCGGIITCRKLVARIETKEWAKENNCWKEKKDNKKKKLKNKLEDVSMVGRIAYLVMCCETYLKSKYPERDWSFVAQNMWDVTNAEYWNDWTDKYVGFIPSVLFDYEKYDKEELGECYTQKEFELLKKLYSGLTEGIEDDPEDEFAAIITKPFDFCMAYEGTGIGDGSEGYSLIEETENILEKNGISLPDYRKLQFSSFSEFNGWGYKFDGTYLSIILGEK